jgi:hypothetical protein
LHRSWRTVLMRVAEGAVEAVAFHTVAAEVAASPAVVEVAFRMAEAVLEASAAPRR